MRCKSCDVILTDDEACRLDPHSGEFEELCTSCLELAFDEDLYGEEDFQQDQVQRVQEED